MKTYNYMQTDYNWIEIRTLKHMNICIRYNYVPIIWIRWEYLIIVNLNIKWTQFFNLSEENVSRQVDMSLKSINLSNMIESIILSLTILFFRT